MVRMTNESKTGIKFECFWLALSQCMRLVLSYTYQLSLFLHVRSSSVNTLLIVIHYDVRWCSDHSLIDGPPADDAWHWLGPANGPATSSHVEFGHNIYLPAHWALTTTITHATPEPHYIQPKSIVNQWHVVFRFIFYLLSCLETTAH